MISTPRSALGAGVRHGVTSLHLRHHGDRDRRSYRRLRGVRDVENFDRKPTDSTGQAKAGGYHPGEQCKTTPLRVATNAPHIVGGGSYLRAGYVYLRIPNLTKGYAEKPVLPRIFLGQSFT